MRVGLFLILMSGAVGGQTMVESAAAAAGGSVGEVARQESQRRADQNFQ